MFKFDPISAQEAQTLQQPFGEGEYDFIVDMCEQKTSQGGNNMIVAHITIFSPENRSLPIKDYILPEHSQMKYKWRQFCESVNLASQYESGTIILESMRGLHGRCFIKHEKERDGDRLFCKVKYYIAFDPNRKITAPVFNDDIAF
jgi:hypothetical protein